MDRVDDLISRVPRRLTTPLWALATLLALVGSGLLLHASVYGSWGSAVGGLLAFGAAAGAWQVADRTAHR